MKKLGVFFAGALAASVVVGFSPAQAATTLPSQLAVQAQTVTSFDGALALVKANPAEAVNLMAAFDSQRVAEPLDLLIALLQDEPGLSAHWVCSSIQAAPWETADLVFAAGGVLHAHEKPAVRELIATSAVCGLEGAYGPHKAETAAGVQSALAALIAFTSSDEDQEALAEIFARETYVSDDTLALLASVSPTAVPSEEENLDAIPDALSELLDDNDDMPSPN